MNQLTSKFAFGSLFKSVDETRLQEPLWSSFVALLDNYNPHTGQVEPALTASENTETQEFLFQALSSPALITLKDFLVAKGKSSQIEVQVLLIIILSYT